MKKRFTIPLILCLFLFPSIVNGQAPKKTTPPTQKMLFDKFFALDDGDTTELRIKAGMMLTILKMDDTSKYAKYMRVYVGMIDKKDIDGTLLVAEQMVNKYPDFAEGYFIYGQILDMANKSGAIEQIHRCIELNPKLVQPYYLLANKYTDADNYKVSLFYYDQLEKVYPKHGSLYYNRGCTKDKLNDVPGAIADYSKCIVAQPKHAKAIFNRGRDYSMSKDWAKAEADFNVFVTLMPSYGTAYYYRGGAKYNQGRTSEGCDDWRLGKMIGDQSCIKALESYCK